MSKRHLERVRKICLSFPGRNRETLARRTDFLCSQEGLCNVLEQPPQRWKDSGHVSGAPGFQATLIEAAPKKFYHPPYVGVRGWIGIHLNQLDDAELASHLREAWRLIAPKKLVEKTQDSG